MRRHFSPDALTAPFGRYHHAVHLARVSELLALSGLLAVRDDGSVPDTVEEQATMILAGIDACLAEAGMDRTHLVRLSAFITKPAYRTAYMAVRDAWVADPPPASTLVLVKALAVPECKIEIEATAARP